MNAQEKVQQSSLLLDFTIERVADAVIWLDSNARIYRVNDAACRNLGYSRDELLQMTIHDINPEYPADIWPEHWERIRKHKSLTFESQHRAKDGRMIPVEISTNYIEYQSQEFNCSFVRDITERKRAEEILQNALVEVEQLKNRLQEENIYLQDEIKLQHNFDEIVGSSKALKKALKKVEQVAPTDATVLILGETGTGKELIARAIHNTSGRKKRPLVKINCAAIPANLIESELFGHEKGAFTGALKRKVGRFELADSGTIFLDEIGDLSHELQAKLLRVLQEGEFERLGDTHTLHCDVRVIAATHIDLIQAIARGDFREDLYYRLNTFPIELPPLRERVEDIQQLVKHFIAKYSGKTQKPVETISQKAMDMLCAYPWPGNVRELENIIERGVIVTQGSNLEPGDWLPQRNATSETTAFHSLEEHERNHILQALKRTSWRVSGPRGAAALLKINPKTLQSRIKKLNISRPD